MPDVVRLVWLILGLLSYLGLYPNEESAVSQPTVPAPAAVSAQEPPSVLAAPPTRLQIPSVGIDAESEVYTNEMVAESGGVNPTASDIVSWWSGGGMPGDDADNTVYIYGHTWTGPAVFNTLKQVENGAPIAITTSNGDVTYMVQDKFTVAKPDLSADPRVNEVMPGRLVLIACWRETGNEPTTTHNLVVVAQIVEG